MAQMAELFDKDRTVIGRHIRNIYKEEELERNITCAKFAHMGADGDQEYEYTAYNLTSDVTISSTHLLIYVPPSIITTDSSSSTMMSISSGPA